jgi:hypothetical protein
MDYAQALGLPILPVLIGDVESSRIDPIFNAQSVDYRYPDVKAGMALIAAVDERGAQRKDLPDPLPEAPPVPYEYLQRHGAAIHAPQPLSASEQSAMLADLRQALHNQDDETVRNDIRRLLLDLRRRADVTNAAATEIDQFLAASPASDSPSGRKRFSRKTAAVGAVSVGVIAIIAIVGYVAIGRTSQGSAANQQSAGASQPPAAKAPVTVAQLDGLLLSTDQINTALGTTGLGIRGTSTRRGDASGRVADMNCRAIGSVEDASTYAGSGWTSTRFQWLQQPPQGDDLTLFANQGVALFPSTYEAAGLFTTLTQRWSDCSHRQFTDTGPPIGVWTTGPVSNTDGTLSITFTQEGGDGWNCQHALTVANNVGIEAVACSRQRLADAAVNIAHQIADKVAKL